MKRLTSLALYAFILLVLVSPSPAAEKKVRLLIPDLCASNMFLIESIFRDTDGVSEVELDVNNVTAFVSFDDEKTGVEDFKKALNKYTYSISRAEFIQGEP